MWNHDKISFFENNYLGLKNYEIQYTPAPEDVRIQKTRTNRALFENRAIEMVEFDTAMKKCGDFWIYFAHFIGQMPFEGIAWFLDEDTKVVREKAYIARKNLKKYLFDLYKERSKK